MSDHKQQPTGSPVERQATLLGLAEAPTPTAPAYDLHNPYAGAVARPKAVSGLGSGISNTDPPIPKKSLPPSLPNSIEAGGFDTLEIASYGSFSRVRFYYFRQTLQAAQLAAQQSEAATVVMPCGRPITVSARGARLGNAYARWVLHCEDVEFSIVDDPAHNPNRLSVRIRMGSTALMEHGHQELWRRAVRILESWGYTEVDNIVSRADICVDLPEVCTHAVVGRVVRGYRVTLARKSAAYQYGDRYIGYSVGRETHMRIYDKLQELRDKEVDDRKYNLLVAHRWGYEPEKATRVEFQLRRSTLREQFNINTVDELFESIGVAVDFLMLKWFRVTKTKNRGEHQEQLKPTGLWSRIYRAFHEWIGLAVLERPKREVKPVASGRLVKQGMGCLASYAARTGRTVDELHHCLVTAWEEEPDTVTGFQENVRRKRRALRLPGRQPLSDRVPWREPRPPQSFDS